MISSGPVVSVILSTGKQVRLMIVHAARLTLDANRSKAKEGLAMVTLSSFLSGARRGHHALA